MPDFDLVVIGDFNPDLTLSGPDVAPQFGQAELLVERSSLIVRSCVAPGIST
jgi:hypothetical protein